MKVAVKICRIVLYLVGIFFILMSFDMFDMNQYTFWERIFGFFMNSLPGIILLLLNYLLRKKDLIYGIFLLGASIFLFFFFNFHIDMIEKIPVILIVIFPMVIAGVILIIARNKYNKPKQI